LIFFTELAEILKADGPRVVLSTGKPCTAAPEKDDLSNTEGATTEVAMEADRVVAAMADVAAIVGQRRMVRGNKLGCLPSFEWARKYEREGQMRVGRLLPYPKGKVTHLLVHVTLLGPHIPGGP